MSNPISANDVKRLRDMTNAPMMDCKKALGEAGGNMDKAVQWLREQNKMKGEKVAMRETAEGRIAVYMDAAKAVAAIVELRCESAPVAKGNDFVQLANDVARHVADSSTPAANAEELLGQKYFADPKRNLKDRIEDVIGLIKENMKIARFTRMSGGQFGAYVHFDGTVGVLIQVEGTATADPQMLKDICMHITAKQPAAARREEVDPAVVEREREIAKHQAAQSGKPANIAEKIAEGKLKTWFAENVLVEQPFVKDDSKTVGSLLQSAGLTVKRFVRYKVGELT
jgi:elongation factor Ts